MSRGGAKAQKEKRREAERYTAADDVFVRCRYAARGGKIIGRLGTPELQVKPPILEFGEPQGIRLAAVALDRLEQAAARVVLPTGSSGGG